MQKGQSIIEIIIALALFVIIAGSAAVAILSSFTTTRLAKEETQASMFANQGLEAVQSIRNQDWDNLTNGNHGLVGSSSIWAFSGISDDPDGSGKFSRIIAISDVYRDPDGQIGTPGGTLDPTTKLIQATVTWDFTPSRTNAVSLSIYLTDWQRGRNVPGAGAPQFGSCNEYCINQAFSSGSCLSVFPKCASEGGTYKPVGNVYCSGSSTDTCCCK